MIDEKIIKEEGELSIHTENIFPIIKKWLYSDHEIFLRELVSNASDAIQKLNHFIANGEYKAQHDSFKIDISIDKEKKTIRIRDNGIGMTADEVKKYINQIAFSGAEEFVQKYKGGDKNSQIIGHFGLGFYSSYMVSKLVEIHSKSYLEGSQAVHWTCDGSTKYSLTRSDKTDVGTEIILHIDDENLEFLESHRISSILNTYCRYYPVAIFFEEKQLNEINPIWNKSAKELTDDDYKNFYKKEFPFQEEPHFWIHLNVDFPFHLNGILYFPKLKNDYDPQKSFISLYSNQVFVSNQINDILPEYLQLLHGVLDSPDIPLNVSRSFLQKDANVKKISGHITKKIADKLKSLFTNEREQFQKYWDDIHPIIKYGVMRDDDFAEKVKETILLKSISDNYYTLNEYKEKFIATNMDKNNKCVVIYSNDTKQQSAFIHLAKEKGYDIILLDHYIDSHFISMFEHKMTDFKFVRVDSNAVDKLIDKEIILPEVDKIALEFYEMAFKEVLKKDKLKINLETMSNSEIPAMLILSEEQRRMKEMMRAMNPAGASLDDLFGDETIVLNYSNPSIQRIKLVYENDKEKAAMLIEHIYDLASLSQKPLEKERLTNFIKRSSQLIESY